MSLWNKLNEIDPESAQKIHFNQRKRIIRAIEIFTLSGKKKSENEKYEKSDLDYLLIGLNMDREKLYERINLRVDLMLKNGLLEEVENLVKMGLSEKNQSMQAIGYKEVLDYFNSKCDKETMVEKIKQNTRRYAKRQITFFKKIPNIVWLENNDEVVEKILNLYYDE